MCISVGCVVGGMGDKIMVIVMVLELYYNVFLIYDDIENGLEL